MNHLSKKLLLMGSSGITILTFFMLLGAWRMGNGFLDTISGFFQPTQPQVDIPTLIVEQMRDASELTTTVFVTQAFVPTSADRKLGELVVATTKLLYLAHGEVRAGVDLSELTQNDIKVINNEVEITLPPAEIIDSKIDVNSSQVYDYNRGFLGLGPDVAPDLQTLAQRETLSKIVDSACSQGILEQANKSAVFTVTKLLNTSGYKNVEVKTSPLQPCQKTGIN